MNKKAKSNSTDVGKRINDTKREIAHLSEELEELINANVNKHHYLPDNHKKSIEKKDLSSQIFNQSTNSMKAQNLDDSLIMKYSKPCRVTPINFIRDMDKVERVSKKTKSYNKEAAREFIRQQRERREQERKKLNSKSKIEQESKKQKLYELQQKSFALVQRNVQLKQERSKSRENQFQIRMDKSNCPRNAAKVLDKDSSTVVNHKVKNTSNKLKNVPTKIEKGKCNITNVFPQRSKEELNKYVLNVTSGKEDHVTNQELGLIKFIPSEYITMRSDTVNCLPYADQDLAATKIQAYYRGYRLRKMMKFNSKAKSHHFTKTNICTKQSKETQTNVEQQKIETPIWLQPPSVDPYPCNFINTIKRKLQFVVNSVNSRDIGTQSSIISNCGHELVKSRNEYEDKIQVGVKSFMEDDMIPFQPRICSNLDADALQHLVLVHNEEKKKPISNVSGESESDTSKNIPDISSETVSCKSKNSNMLIINTDRIEDLHLSNTANINEKAISQIFQKTSRDSADVGKSMSKKSYTFNFCDEVKTENVDDSIKEAQILDQEFVRSSRDSIISYNRSEYGNTSHEINTDSSCTSLGSNHIISEKEQTGTIVKQSILTFNGSDSDQNKSNIVTKSNVFEKCNRSSRPKITEKLENSMNTSLISHVSDNRSEGSYASSRPSKKNSKPSTNERSASNKRTYYETSKTITELVKHHILEPSLNLCDLRSQICLEDLNEPVNTLEDEPNKSLSSSTIDKLTNFISEERSMSIPKHRKVNVNSKNYNLEELTEPLIPLSSSPTTKSLKHNAILEKSPISTECSRNERTNFFHKEDSQKTCEFMSLNSSTFSSEKTGSYKKAHNISEQNKLTKSGKKHLENEIHEPDNLKCESDVNNLDDEIDNNSHLVKNVNTQIFCSKGDTNEIHLKFEAEVHLLNDFNESLKQFMAVEKAFETIKSKNDESCTKFHGRSSVISNGPSFSEHSDISVNLNKNLISSINISRGSEIDESHFSNESMLRTPWKSMDNSIELKISNAEENIEKSNITTREKLPNNLAGLSIKMFEQLIKDEDVRIENLKTIIKIREQALLDRTKGELAWLEIQRKHLKETGKLYEASIVKKKQRGILLKHQQERREMQRLKQLQKVQSNERKMILKEQRNLIKAKLTSEKIISELKIHTPRKRQANGPMKVLKTSGSIHSETSMSKKTSEGEEIISITSKSQSFRLSEVESNHGMIMNEDETNISLIRDNKNLSNMKKALFIRQIALMERRKAVENLLYRHQKLLEEEKKIEELEIAANAIIMQIPSVKQSKSVVENKLRVKDQQLHELFLNEEISSDKKSVNNKSYYISQSFKPLEENANCHMQPCADTLLQESSHNKSSIRYISGTLSEIENSENNNVEISESRKTDEGAEAISKKISFEYSEDFELDTVETVNDVALIHDPNENNLSSISELIQDFSEIEHGISMLSKEFNPVSYSMRSSGSENMNESVIETKTNENFNNSTEKDNSIIVSDILQCEENSCPEVETFRKHELLESSKHEDICGTEKVFSSNISVEEPSYSTDIEMQNTSEIMSNKIIPISNTETMLLKTRSENTLKESNMENNSRIYKTEFQNDLSNDKTSVIDSVTTKSEAIISSDIPLELITDVNLEGGEPLHERFIVEVEPKDLFKSENSINCEVVAEATKCVTKSVNDVSMKKTHDSINKNFSDCEQVINNTQTGCEFNRNIGEKNDEISSFKNTKNSKERSTENSTNLKQSNLGFIPKEKKSEKFDNICEDKLCHVISSEFYLDKQNCTKSKLEEHDTKLFSPPKYKTVLSEQTNHDDILVSNNSDNHIDTQISNTMTYSNNLLSPNKKSTSDKTNYDYNDGNYSSITKLFENEQSKFNNTTGLTSTDISEKLSSDSEHLNIAELSPSDTSANYTDNFEDDMEGDSLSQKNLNSYENNAALSLPAKNECSSEIQNGNSLYRKENKVLIMKIDLKQLDNEANIIVMEETKPYYMEKNFDSDKIETVKTVYPPRIIELSSVSEDIKKIVVDDISVTEQESDLKTTESRNEHLEIIKPEIRTMNVRDRVSEILLNTVDSPKSTRDKDIRYQDYYVTTYDDVSPVNSPESVSPVKSGTPPSINIFGTEAEELLKKQIAIEQEIKHLEQQQKEHLPFVYMREIPNKPPPPYTPPSNLSNQSPTILPSKVEDIDEICNYSAKVLYNAYLSNNLDIVTFSQTDFKSINETKSTEECCLFVFDLCREVAKNHYKRFEKDNVPYWLKLSKDSRLVLGKPFDYCKLEKYINTKVKGLLGFKKENMKENSIVRWSKKKKDHVDEILALESQFEEQDWLDYDKDELMVKNEVTNHILNILLKETLEVYMKIFS